MSVPKTDHTYTVSYRFRPTPFYFEWKSNSVVSEFRADGCKVCNSSDHIVQRYATASVTVSSDPGVYSHRNLTG